MDSHKPMMWQEHIEAALNYDPDFVTHTIDDVQALIDSEEAHLWQGERSAAVIQIIEYPQFKCCHMWLCGGDMEEITEVMLPKAEEWARKMGCSKATTAGRIGWIRVMNKHGYSNVASVCAKDLL